MRHPTNTAMMSAEYNAEILLGVLRFAEDSAASG